MPLNVIVRGLPNYNMKKIMTTNYDSPHHAIFCNLFLTSIYFLQHLYSTTVTLLPFPHSQRPRFHTHTKQQADLEFCITTYLRTYLQNKKTENTNRLQARLFQDYFVLIFILKTILSYCSHSKLFSFWHLSKQSIGYLCVMRFSWILATTCLD